jgi:hypothetical protein
MNTIKNAPQRTTIKEKPLSNGFIPTDVILNSLTSLNDFLVYPTIYLNSNGLIFERVLYIPLNYKRVLK